MKVTSQISMATLGPGKMIGEQELLLGFRTLTTGICSSLTTKIMLIKKEEILKIKQ